jgi:cytidylate kinase
MDGRDIGTAVFPEAELKLFMTADIEVRVQRRFDEMTSKGNLVSEIDVKRNLLDRDYEDTHRKENPLIKAKDAIILDNSDLDKQQQLDFVMRLINDLLLIKE